MGWRRVWRDLRLRRPAFDLVADPASPVRYRGRPFSLDRLPVDDVHRRRIRAWAERADSEESGAGDQGHALAEELADLLRAPVALEGTVHRPAG